MKLSGQLFEQYKSDPSGMDSTVRASLAVPADRYYAVTMFPEPSAGVVRLTLPRTVRAHKVSKSDQS